MRELFVVEIRVSSPYDTPVVVLKEDGGVRQVPIWMTANGAAGIVAAWDEPAGDQVMTHDFIVDILAAVERDVSWVEIVEERAGQFFTEVVLGETRVPARPSDAIALALRVDCPIYCAEEVLDRVGVEGVDADDLGDAELGQPEQEVEKFRQFLDSVTPNDFETGPAEEP